MRPLWPLALMQSADRVPTKSTRLSIAWHFAGSPDRRFRPFRTARRSRIFADHRASAFEGVGDILQPIASGAIRKEDVLGDVYDLVGGGVPGRLGTNDITFFKSAGGDPLDLMTAQAIMSQLDARA
jgi:ornithine cyclodeaminase/alanine dehydrogenase-like protein (mu-crystallin family)